MKYKIVYDKPGRIRIRMGQGAFTAEQGYGIEELLLSRAEVITAEASHVNGGLLICYRSGGREEILSAIAALEYRMLPLSQKRNENRIKELDESFLRSVAISLVRHYALKLLIPTPLRVLITLRRASRYWRKGIHSLLRGRLGIDVLDAAAVMAASVQGDYSTASSIMMLLHISELLEDYMRKKVRHTLTQSLALNIDGVWLVEEGRTDRFTPISQIQIGEKIRVQTGHVIPLDGEVISGEAIVNESAMTGEALGVLRSEHHSVYAGTVIEDGTLVIKVRTLADNTRIQNIVTLIEHSESLKATIQSRAEKLADSIVPLSFLASFATLIITRNIVKAMSVLMVDYSCAIKLTTPICVISAMHEATKIGVLVKGGKYLEAYANADTCVFDKTGTLTSACPEVVKVVAFNGHTRNEVLKVSACLEEHFPHSVAKAIVRQAELEELHHREEHAEVQYIVAHGISSMLRGERVLIGSAHFVFEDEAIPITDDDKALIDAVSNGQSSIFLAIGNRLAGMICVHDPVRAEAACTLKKLRMLGIKHFIMLTGDNHSAATAVCNAIGIDEFYAQTLPEQKADIIKTLKNRYGVLIMVGDGVNDAPALSCADVSIAMRDGSDIAKEVADITLKNESLNALVSLRILSMALFERINRNYRFILGFNSSLLLLGVCGLIAPRTSALLHNISTMSLAAMSTRPYLHLDDGNTTTKKCE